MRRTGRFLPLVLVLGAIVLSAAACGAEAVPSEESSSADSWRVESATRELGLGPEDEDRISSVVDTARGRSSYVESRTGCGGVTIGDVDYAEIPRGAGMPAGKRWVKSVLSAADDEAAFEESQKEQADSDNVSTRFIFGYGPEPSPAEYLGYLREHGELARNGEEDVRGVPTRRYRTTLYRKQLMREQFEREGWKDANIDKYLETVPETKEEVEVWVDAADLTRRVVTTSTTEVPRFGTHRSVTTTEYFDFGVAAAIEAPPATEVIGWEEWQRLQEQQLPERIASADEEASSPLPGAFEPSVAPSCLH